MQISGYQTHPVRVVDDEGVTGTHVVLRLRTSEGIEGVSYVSRLNDQTVVPLKRLLENLLEPLIGEDATDPERVYRRLYRQDDALFGMPVGLEARAASAIDAALWDVTGKAAGQPVFRLMGGTRNRLPVSANWGVDHGPDREALAESVQRHLDRGFRAVKFRAGQLDQATLVEHFRALREIAGPDVRLIADANQRWTVKQAIRMGEAIAPYDPYWIEDPVPHHDPEGLRAVTEALPIPICAGEAYQTIPPLRRLIEERCSDLVMVDLDLGLSGFRRVATLAEMHRVPLVNHLASEVLAHAVAAAPTGQIVGFYPWAEPLFMEPATIEDGELVLSSRPGLGLELNREALKRFALT